MNRAEEYVLKLCKRTFLSLWSYANPLGKDRKELCDILVLCEPDVIIFSVKEIRPSDSGDLSLDWKRWNRKAVEESVKQIYGAERWLRTATSVVKSDGSLGLPLPDKSSVKFHRVAVALGGKDKVPITYGDFGKGFIHVWDEISSEILMEELDTMSDLISYLSSKEKFFAEVEDAPLIAGEENLLALYLHLCRKFPENSFQIIGSDLWNAFAEREEYKRKKKEDGISYFWDKIVEEISIDVLKGNLEFSSPLGNEEKVLRVMAREDRFSRRILAKAFTGFLFSEIKVRSRWVISISGIIYVFLALPSSMDRKVRRAELGLRCFIVRGLNPQCDKVLGIATEQYVPGTGHSFDLHYLFQPIWHEEHQQRMQDLQKETGFFTESRKSEASEDEYPN